LGPGLSINADIADEVDVLGFPDWDIFEPEDLVDMTGPLRERLRSESRPQPAAIARDPLPEMTADRLAIPTTIICCEFTAAQLSKWMLSEPERFSELRQLSDVSYIELPTGHWPQFTKPRELAAALLSVA
jgi:pimeloyl-ACP methyl ester carboxylesterase